MAVVTTTSHGFYAPEFLARHLLGEIISVTSSEVRFFCPDVSSSTSYVGIFEGNFKTSAFDQITGNITSYSFAYKTSEFITIEGMNLDASTILDLVGTKNIDGLLETMFSQDDTFNLQLYQGFYGSGQIVNAFGGNDIVFGSTGADLLIGGRGQDTLHGSLSEDTLHGGYGKDILFGQAAKDIIFGEAQDDSLYGGWDNDKLYGGIGADLLDGSLGADWISGGLGADKLMGGSGADIYRFTTVGDSSVAKLGRDIIEDFSSTEGDRIGLSLIDANTKIQGDQNFIWLGIKAFSRSAGELRYVVTSSGSLVLGDINGDGRADFSIEVSDVSTIYTRDFIF